MDILAELQAAFPPSPSSLTDAYIEQNYDPMSAAPTDNWLVVMPAYMSWCIRSPRRNELLVLDFTVHALANFGRFRKSEPDLSFALQRSTACGGGEFSAVVLESGVMVDEEQVERSLRQWMRND